jgi:hypothetical protein
MPEELPQGFQRKHPVSFCCGSGWDSLTFRWDEEHTYPEYRRRKKADCLPEASIAEWTDSRGRWVLEFFS